MTFDISPQPNGTFVLRIQTDERVYLEPMSKIEALTLMLKLSAHLNVNETRKGSDPNLRSQKKENKAP